MNEQPYADTPSSATPQTSGMAVGSLIASIVGFTIVPIIGGIVGLILGYIARKQIRESEGTFTGAGLALAGIIMGWIQVVLLGLPICAIVVLTLMGPSVGGIFSNIIMGI
ncbi:MAG: DUF4190 domain-containing protein [Chloroflexota bacterium]|nr:DUF4190 domain-containing protein [Chloroflexota bacterium]